MKLKKKNCIRFASLVMAVMCLICSSVTGYATAPTTLSSAVDYKSLIINSSSLPTVEYSPTTMEQLLEILLPVFYGESTQNVVINYGGMQELDRKNLEYITSSYAGRYPFATLFKGTYDNNYGHVYLNTASQYFMVFYSGNAGTSTSALAPYTTISSFSTSSTTTTQQTNGLLVTNGNILPNTTTTSDQSVTAKTIRKARLIASKVPEGDANAQMTWILKYLYKNYDKKNTKAKSDSMLLSYNYLIKKKTTSVECRYAAAALIARYCGIPCIYVPVIKSGSDSFGLLFVNTADDNKLYYAGPGSIEPHRIKNSDKIVIDQYNRTKWLLANEIYLMQLKQTH